MADVKNGRIRNELEIFRVEDVADDLKRRKCRRRRRRWHEPDFWLLAILVKPSHALSGRFFG